MRLLLLACFGGAIGAGLRHMVNVGAIRMFGLAFPVGTLFVNVVGSFLMGVLVEVVLQRFDGSPELRTFAGTGVLGGFTTFSAFSLETMTFIERGATGQAVLYVVLSIGLSVLGLALGLWLARGLWA